MKYQVCYLALLFIREDEIKRVLKNYMVRNQKEKGLQECEEQTMEQTHTHQSSHPPPAPAQTLESTWQWKTTKGC